MKLLHLTKSLASILVLILSVQVVTPVIALTRSVNVLQESEIVIPDGTEFTVETTEEISSKTAAEGDPLSFKVAEDVKINGQTVIAAGTLVKGSVSNAKKAGMMGKGGQLGIRVESTTTVDGQKLKLRSSKGKEGDDKTGTTVALVVLFGPLGFLKHGKNAKIKEGTKIKVFSDEEKKVQIKG
jgi:hypothetical protein